ncbi:anthranilate synthase component I family protein [Anditalea andensis]|uniref:Chorismate-utilising enzyme C-terminal domain-containing protein n=1 Tax=Anditalea andensis TaxID=1048983 RepID=A0A074KX29_9BACT|nr:anthranilate synthase component I family protein [Anditalea andensis]KEO74536.1 hypothetical protein EL17_02355 [Anditalea andensis]
MKLKVPLEQFLRQKLIKWAENRYTYVAYFTDNNIHYPYSGFQDQLMAGNQSILLHDIPSSGKEVVGIISYDFKNRIEDLGSNNKSIINHPDQLFFLPEIKISISDDVLIIDHPSADILYQEILHTPLPTHPILLDEIKALTNKEQYLQNVDQIKQRIIEGDVYELNYCIAFESDIKEIAPTSLFLKLMEASPMPFSAYFKANDQVLVCASPERFIKRQKSKIIAQPIKGTIRRGSTPLEDQKYKNSLLNSEKERSENLMIVDLMRNDLSKISSTGSVSVEELFGIYSFRHVHQMISTISAVLNENCTIEEVFQNTFPMGSMTGAPKIKSMELIDHYENFKRGWFSGTVGYLDKDGNFDFNVIIRSIFIDFSSSKIMFAVGSAITFDSVPEQEYEECLLKVRSILEVLNA